MKHAFKASQRHETDSKIEQHHFSGGGGIFFPAKIGLSRGEIHDDTRGNLLFSSSPGGNPRANASRPKRWWWGGETPVATVIRPMRACAADTDSKTATL